MRSQLQFQRLFEEELDFVVAALRRLGVADRDVPDVAQEVFLSIHRRIETFDPERRRRPWIFGFVRRAAANHRRLARHRELSDADGVDRRSSVAPGPYDLAEVSERARRVQRVLQQMPDALRDVLVMKDLYEFTTSEIADELDLPPGTVSSRIKRAREHFRLLMRRPRLVGTEGIKGGST